MDEEVYGPERAERLVALLRALAERIQELDQANGLLEDSLAAGIRRTSGIGAASDSEAIVDLLFSEPDLAKRRR